MPGEATLAFSAGFSSTARSTSTLPSTRRSCSTEMPPGRSTRGISVTTVITVDSTPTSQSPPFTMPSTRPMRSSHTCGNDVGLGRPERFADGAASGTPAALMIARAVGSDGMRTATGSRPPVVCIGTSGDFFMMMVSGPGQKASASFLAASGISSTSAGNSLISAICTMSGLSDGRPFTL